MQQMNANRVVEIVLPNELGYERIAMACSAAFAQLQGLHPSRIEDLKTIVAEASTNAMQHGNGGRAEARVTIRIERMPDAIRVIVTDEGRGFDNTIRDPDIERIINDLEAPIGFGLFLIRNLADEVTYALSPEGGHRVEMRIALQP
jgi:anti-sigma regulatory factor (Ser/Thr protein kinase)